jgi:hypothetical protein
MGPILMMMMMMMIMGRKCQKKFKYPADDAMVDHMAYKQLTMTKT